MSHRFHLELIFLGLKLLLCCELPGLLLLSQRRLHHAIIRAEVLQLLGPQSGWLL